MPMSRSLLLMIVEIDPLFILSAVPPRTWLMNSGAIISNFNRFRPMAERSYHTKFHANFLSFATCNLGTRIQEYKNTQTDGWKDGRTSLNLFRKL